MDDGFVARDKSEALDALTYVTSHRAEHWLTRLREVAAQDIVGASGHANGYWKVMLRRFTDGSKLRLHAWSGPINGNIHNHRWDFTSTVLTGALSETLFSISPQHEGRSYAVFDLHSNQLRETSRTRQLIMIGKSTLVRGATYWRTGSMFHSVAAVQNGTISLVATSPPDKARIAEVMPHHGDKPFATQSYYQELAVDEFFRILGGMVEKIGAIQ